MHFAVGMGCAGVMAGAACLWLRRGWRWVPAAMTAGGLWALVPDLPRLWREDFAWLPLAATLGDKGLERELHAMGTIFFFHQQLDAQPNEYALHGLIGVVLLYNLALGLLMLLQRRQSHGIANRVWHAHAPHLPKALASNVKATPATLPQHAQAHDDHGELPPTYAFRKVRSSHLSRAS